MFVPLKTLLALFVTASLCGAGSAVLADSPTTLVVLNPDELVAIETLAERLGGIDDVRLLERTDAGSIVPAPSSDAPADVLVVLQASETDSAAIDVVICETQYGLRLASDHISSSDEAGDLVEQLAAVVERALRKRSEPIEKVIAVIPFRDDSLNGRGMAMAATATRAVERRVLGFSGTFLLEASRASAISNELARSKRQKVTATLAPSYLLGNCRIDGPTTDPSVWCDLILMQRGIAVAARVSEANSVENSVASIETQTGEILKRVPASTSKISEQDVVFLGTQADEYDKSGRWQSAIGCAEAALLIDPSQNELRRVAVQSLSGLVKAMRLQPSPASSGLSRSPGGVNSPCSPPVSYLAA